MARRSVIRLLEASAMFEGLEGRTLMSAPYEFKSLVDAYGFEAVIREHMQPSETGSLGYGAAISGLGDINADGYADYAIAWPERQRVDLLSGKDGATIRMLERTDIPLFGQSLANIGDVNGDGVSDLAVGSWQYDADDDGVDDKHGGVWIFSGADGAELRSITGTGDADELGWVIVPAGDMNGDSTPDFIVGAPGAGPSGEGQAYVYSGADGTVLRMFVGTGAGDRFGHAIAARDLAAEAMAGKGDGIAEFLIGAPFSDGTDGVDHGRAYLFDGATGSLIRTYTGQYAENEFGTAVAIAVGVQGAVLLMGAPGYGEYGAPAYGAPDGGALYSYSWQFPASTNVQISYTEGMRKASWISNLGELRWPGSDTVAVTAGSGAVELYDARTSYMEFVSEYTMIKPTQTGSRPVAAGDVNGDGFMDLITGSRTTAGAVKVSSGLFLLPQAGYGSTALNLSGMSDNSRYAWATPDYAAGIDSSREEVGGYLIADGVMMSTRRIPGFGRGVIFGVNDSGHIIGAELTPGGTGTDVLGKRFILRDGVKTYLKDEVTSIEGTVAPNLDTIQFVKLGNGGHIVLQSTTPTGYLSWLLNERKLSLLWEGFVNDVNTAGTVLGVQWKASEVGRTVVQTADGRTVTLDKFYNAGAINDKGQVAGNYNGQLAVWDKGAITVIAANPPTYGTPREVSWFVYDIDNRGRVLGSFRQDYGYGPNGQDYFYSPRMGLKAMYEMTGTYSYSGPDSPHHIRDNGWMMVPYGIMQLSEVSEVEPGTPIRSIQTPRGTVAVGITDEGQGYVSSSVRDGRLNQILPTASDGSSTGPTLTDINVYVDPRDGQIYVVGQSASGVHWWKLTQDGHGNPSTISTTSASTSIVRGMTVFTSADGRVHIAGMNADGEMVIYFQNNSASPDSPLNWSASNLSVEHLGFQELETPVFRGEFTSYVAPWNGLNIVGLDENGDLQTIWWAPGMTYWRVDNLSDIAGTPALSGTVSGYVTSWGGLNVAGTDAEGNLQVAWWAPGMTDWRSDPIDNARLTPGSISTYITPWGGLNIAGLDENGDVAVAWWAPGGNDEWTFENLGGDMGRFGMAGLDTDMMISGVCSSDGRIELFCRQPDTDPERPWLKSGHMVRLFLDPVLQTWMAEDVSVTGI